jgi:predicted Zn finger-like uncharacterized protein
MLLACPHCDTKFQVAANAIGNGRTVRCAQCRESWFAEPERTAAELAMAFAQDESASSFERVPAPSGWDEAHADVEDSPPLAAETPPDIIVSAEDRIVEPAVDIAPEAEPEPEPAPPPVRKPKRVKNYRLPRPVAMALVLAILSVISLLGPRESVVRLVPDLAGVYAAIGLPVNLRGLEFRGVKTTQEMQDGIPVLVIEGEVVNIAKHPVEVPRVRIAVLGPAHQELYSWTTLLQRSILGDNEKISFRSRLASPPPAGQEVLVRFLTRSDLTGGT